MYILVCTNVDTQSQDFEEDIVTLPSLREPSLLSSQNQTLRREIIPCQEDEEFFVKPDAAGMEEAIGKFWMAWRARIAVALQNCIDSLQNFLCLQQSNAAA